MDYTLSHIVAAAENDVIGRQNKLPWHLPNDFRYFKNKTWGMPIIMGRKSFEALKEPLPGRMNIVITTQTGWKPEGAEIAHSIEDAIAQAQKADTREIFIIGGGEIFRQTMDVVSRIYLTRVHARVEGDTLYPQIDPDLWHRVQADSFAANDKNEYGYTFEVWERKEIAHKGVYSPGTLALKFVRYWWHARNGKGHGIHSPFIYDLVTRVLNDSKSYPCYHQIEPLRKALLKEDTVLRVDDFGAGSAVLASKDRKVRSIARSSLKDKKFAQLIFRLAQYYHPVTVVELGTSLGITSAYLASAYPDLNLYTFEGSGQIAQRAREVWQELGLDRIRLIQGDFDKTLEPSLESIRQVDMAFVDGNHRKDPTLRYFSMLKKRATPKSVFIFDDIHWSLEMEEAWGEIQKAPGVTVTVDLFFIGLVFFNPDFKAIQHFQIRF